MYAVVSTGGKQLKVEKGTEAVVERLSADVGETVTFDVLFVADGRDIVVDPEELASAKVTAEIVEHFRGDKAVVFKFKKRKGYKRLKGHRQEQTRVRVTEVVVRPAKRTAKKDGPKKTEETPVAKKKSAKKTEEALAAKAVAVEPKAGPAQCEAIKADGEQCSNKAKEGSRYCGVHAKKYDS